MSARYGMIVAALGLLMLAAAAAQAAVYIQENFEGGSLPPGWSTWVTGYPNGGWSFGEESGNHFLHGKVYLNNVHWSYTCTAYIFTNYITLPAGARPRVQFRYRAYKNGNGGWHTAAFLRKGASEYIWIRETWLAANWTTKAELLPAITTAGSDYKFGWYVYGSGTGYQQYAGDINYLVDDVEIRDSGTVVEPNSFGRVKALFR